MKKPHKTLAAGLMASFLAITTPAQSQINEVQQSMNTVLDLTYKEADQNVMLESLSKLKQTVSFLNSFLAANKFRVDNVKKDISELANIQTSLTNIIVLIREYAEQRDESTIYRSLLRDFSNEVFKLKLALSKIRTNHNEFEIINVNGLEFTQQENQELLDTTQNRYSAI